jgi:hypothetical protein
MYHILGNIYVLFQQPTYRCMVRIMGEGLPTWMTAYYAITVYDWTLFLARGKLKYLQLLVVKVYPKQYHVHVHIIMACQLDLIFSEIKRDNVPNITENIGRI